MNLILFLLVSLPFTFAGTQQYQADEPVIPHDATVGFHIRVASENDDSQEDLLKVKSLLSARDNRARILEILGPFCTPSEKYRMNRKSEINCMIRYFELFKMKRDENRKNLHG